MHHRHSHVLTHPNGGIVAMSNWYIHCILGMSCKQTACNHKISTDQPAQNYFYVMVELFFYNVGPKIDW